jgi:glucan-binding YG repeat protein
VIEFSSFLTFASVGMYVIEQHRCKGYAGDILYLESQIAEREGYTAISGCWYYNHNSKKSMESIGGFAKSRLLRFYF